MLNLHVRRGSVLGGPAPTEYLDDRPHRVEHGVVLQRPSARARALVARRVRRRGAGLLGRARADARLFPGLERCVRMDQMSDDGWLSQERMGVVDELTIQDGDPT